MTFKRWFKIAGWMGLGWLVGVVCFPIVAVISIANVVLYPMGTASDTLQVLWALLSLGLAALDLCIFLGHLGNMSPDPPP